MKTAIQVEAGLDQAESPANKPKNKRGDAARIKKWQWKPGQSGNPSGRPKKDIAQEIAQAVFEQNPELVYEAMAKVLKKGSAFGFQVLSDRAYGKVAEEIKHSGEISLASAISAARQRASK